MSPISFGGKDDKLTCYDSNGEAVGKIVTDEKGDLFFVSDQENPPRHEELERIAAVMKQLKNIEPWG